MIRAQSLPVKEKEAENAKNLPVNKTERVILGLLMENSRYTYDELAERINKTRETVRKNLRSLEKKNLIERGGADKNGFWIIKIQSL